MCQSFTAFGVNKRIPCVACMGNENGDNLHNCTGKLSVLYQRVDVVRGGVYRKRNVSDSLFLYEHCRIADLN